MQFKFSPWHKDFYSPLHILAQICAFVLGHVADVLICPIPACQSDPHGWQDLSMWDFCRICVNFSAHLCVCGWGWGRAAAFPNFPPRIGPQCQNVGGKLGGGKCRHVFSNEISRFMRTCATPIQIPHSNEINKSLSGHFWVCNWGFTGIFRCFQMRYRGLWGHLKIPTQMRPTRVYRDICGALKGFTRICEC